MKKIVLVLFLCACDSADHQSAASVASAVARFRAADLASTPVAVETLKATACSGPSCATKDACLAAGEPIAEALRLKSEVEKQIPKVESGELAKDSPEALSLAPRLDQADKSLKKGFDALPACDESTLALKRRFHL